MSQKYNLLKLSALIIHLLIAFVFFTAQAVNIDTDGFHKAKTLVEKALDKIIKLDNSDYNLQMTLLQMPGYEAFSHRYSGLFTSEFSDEWANIERKMVQQECGGYYREGEICGFDYRIITGGQDYPDHYLYHTVSQNDSMATIETIFGSPWIFDKTTSRTFAMVKRNGAWLIHNLIQETSSL